MSEFASVLWIAVGMFALACIGLCLFRAARAARGGEPRRSCCGEPGRGDVTGR